jgi:hypothetical protein
VVVWATGGIGSIAIRAIHQRRNLDLVGVWVHSPEKDGRDAANWRTVIRSDCPSPRTPTR